MGREDPLEEGMATHSNIPAWRIPWTEELGGLQSIGSQSVGQDLIFRSPFHLKPLIYRDGFPGSQNEFRSPQLGIWLPLWSPVHQPDSVLFRKWSEDSRQCPDFCNQPLNDSKSSSHFLCSPLFLYLSTYKCFFRSSFEKRFPLDFKFLFYFLISF